MSVFTFQLLGEILLDRSNCSVMTRYVSSKDNMRVLMNLLRVIISYHFYFHFTFTPFLLYKNRLFISGIAQEHSDRCIPCLQGFALIMSQPRIYRNLSWLQLIPYPLILVAWLLSCSSLWLIGTNLLGLWTYCTTTKTSFCGFWKGSPWTKVGFSIKSFMVGLVLHFYDCVCRGWSVRSGQGRGDKANHGVGASRGLRLFWRIYQADNSMNKFLS